MILSIVTAFIFLLFNLFLFVLYSFYHKQACDLVIVNRVLQSLSENRISKQKGPQGMQNLLSMCSSTMKEFCKSQLMAFQCTLLQMLSFVLLENYIYTCISTLFLQILQSFQYDLCFFCKYVLDLEAPVISHCTLCSQ